MAFFEEHFNGTGFINGHAPDSGFGGAVWAGAGSPNRLSLANGYAYASDAVNPVDNGSASYGDGATDYGTPKISLFNFSFKTGPELLGSSGNFLYVFELVFKIGGKEFSVKVGSDDAGAYGIYFEGDTPQDVAFAGIAINHEYSGTLYVRDGEQFLTINGQELSSGDAFTDPDLGVQKIDLLVGKGHLFGFLASGELSGALTLPMLTVQAGTGPQAALTLPMFQVLAHVVDRGENYFEPLTLPMFSQSGHFGAGAALTLPFPQVEMAGTFVVVARAALTLPMFTVEAIGTAGGTANAALTLPAFKVAGHFGSVAKLTLPALTCEASGTAGSVSRASLTLPMFTVEAEATAQNHITAHLTLPMLQMGNSAIAHLTLPMFRVVAIGSAVVTPSYEGYSVNLLPGPEEAGAFQVTRYTNFPFDSIVRYRDQYYGASKAGLFLLGGDTDFAEPRPLPIDWDWKTCITDFDEARLKTVIAAYFGGRLGRNATVSLHAGEKNPVEYAFQSVRGETAQNHREKFGRGIKARYFAFGASGSDTLELDGIEFDIGTTKRRI